MIKIDDQHKAIPSAFITFDKVEDVVDEDGSVYKIYHYMHSVKVVKK